MLKFYNTLSQKKEVFKPGKTKKVHLFVCGPTTYDFSHLGHARTYVIFDVIVKYLKQKGYDVFYLQNITDIDDKIIKRAEEEKISWKVLSSRFEREYLKDMNGLKVSSVKKYARATEHIPEIISQVKRLVKKGFGYQLKDGIYYDISRFKEYGKLSGRTVLQAEDAVSRIDESAGKRNKGDFCLWKFSEPDEPKWPNPWRPGRPGWHIEDTAITEKYFGPQYDIHGGGRDLIFPHHEAEIAQMEAISGKKPLVKYWLHTGFLTVGGEKMSKSLGNFITIKDFVKKYPPRLLRLFVLKSLYRSPLDYNEKEIEQTERQVERMDEFVEKLRSQKQEAGRQRTTAVTALISTTKADFEKAMDDDFNTPLALAVVFQFMSKVNPFLLENKIGPAGARVILDFLRKIDQVLGIIFWPGKKIVKIPLSVSKLVRERERARGLKNWQRADEIRKEIEKIGYKIEDTAEGPVLKKSK